MCIVSINCSIFNSKKVIEYRAEFWTTLTSVSEVCQKCVFAVSTDSDQGKDREPVPSPKHDGEY